MLGCDWILQALRVISVLGAMQISSRQPHHSKHGPAGTVSVDKPSGRAVTLTCPVVVAYWLCDAIAPGNLRLGSSLVTTGLSWRSAVGIIALGHFLAALLITANGIIGARLHIPYTIQSRAPFGFFFSFFVVFVRLLVGFFWYEINTYNGALCVYAVLVAIWPSFATVSNHLPESANITTQMLTGMSTVVCTFCLVAYKSQPTLSTSSSYCHSIGSTHDD